MCVSLKSARTPQTFIKPSLQETTHLFCVFTSGKQCLLRIWERFEMIFTRTFWTFWISELYFFFIWLFFFTERGAAQNIHLKFLHWVNRWNVFYTQKQTTVFWFIPEEFGPTSYFLKQPSQKTHHMVVENMLICLIRVKLLHKAKKTSKLLKQLKSC